MVAPDDGGDGVQRHASVSELIDDVQRYLDDTPGAVDLVKDYEEISTMIRIFACLYDSLAGGCFSFQAFITPKSNKTFLP